MSELEKYINGLFSKYGNAKDIKELKAEVLSNLEAKVKDLTDAGMEYDEALKAEKESITDVDCLIEGNRKIYINKYKLEYLQVGLLYLLVAWIITIPVAVVVQGWIYNNFLFIVCAAAGVGYFIFYNKKNQADFDNVAVVNLNSAIRQKNMAWVLWGLFITASMLYVTAIQFGSNIWFSRPVVIDGPYQFAEIAIRYFSPFITLLIPLLASLSPKLICKYEAGERDEY